MSECLRSPGRVRITSTLGPGAVAADLADLRRALLGKPVTIPTRYFYDEHGSRLFEQITGLPEYYPTRVERTLLADVADEVISLSEAENLVELGSGAATKTRLLLDAMAQTGRLHRYIPGDISVEFMRQAAQRLCEEYPQLVVHAVIGDFFQVLEHLPEGGRRLVIFLGGTIGNLDIDQRARFMDRLGRAMNPGEFFLLGTDLIKDKRILEAAYNDSSGLTAEFNRNILRVVNNVAQGDFDPGRFEHRAIYNDQARRIEMWLDSRVDQTVSLSRLELEIHFEAEDSILTELSAKYDRDEVTDLLERHGFCLERWFNDPEETFALTLARRL